MKRANLQAEGDGCGVRALAKAHHLPAEVLEIKLFGKLEAGPGQNVSYEMEWVGGRCLMA